MAAHAATTVAAAAAAACTRTEQPQQAQQLLPCLTRKIHISMDTAVEAQGILWRDASHLLGFLPPWLVTRVAREAAHAVLVHQSFTAFPPHTPQHQAAGSLYRLIRRDPMLSWEADVGLYDTCGCVPGQSDCRRQAMALVLLGSELVPVRLAQWVAAVTAEPVTVQLLVSRLQDSLVSRGEDAAALGSVARVRTQLQHPTALSPAECQAMYLQAAAAAGEQPAGWSLAMQALWAWTAAVCDEKLVALHAWGRAGGMGADGAEPQPLAPRSEMSRVEAYCRMVWAANREAAGAAGAEA